MEFCRQQITAALALACVDYNSGKILAYVFGSRKDKIFGQLKALLKPFGIQHFYTDDWGSLYGYSVGGRTCHRQG